MYWGASLEIQYPFYFLPKDSGFRGAVFIDSGSEWGYQGETPWPATGEVNGLINTTAGKLRLRQCGMQYGDSAMPRVSVGASLIWDSPFGPLRFDFAYPVLKQPYDRTAVVPVRRRNAVLIAAATLVEAGRMPDFFPTRTRADDRRDRRAHARQAARRHSARPAHRQHRAARHGASDPTSASSTTRNISMQLAVHARRSVPADAAFRGRRAGCARGAGDGGAVSRLRRGGACAVSGGVAAVIAVRHERPCGGAHVHASARIEAGVTIDPLAVIGPGAEIGAGTLIAAGAVIGPGVAIGRDCAIGAGATVLCALIGDRVIIHPGARIGQDGFGYLPSSEGASENPADPPRHHSGRRRDRRQHHDRPRLAPATPSSARAPRSTISCKSRHNVCYRAALRDRVANRHIGQRRGGRLRHAGRPGRHRRSS